jgi:ABC-type multidrug transport system ATPase subunit
MDPVLRAKVWEFLKKLVKDHQVTILMTTHYIHEAGYADCIGFLRNGSLLIQNSPQKILAFFENQTLDEIFLYSCSSEPIVMKNSDLDDFKSFDIEVVEKKKKLVSFARMEALLYEEMIHFKREPM